MKIINYIVLALAASLTACGDGGNTVDETAAVAAPEKRTCDNIRPDVIRTAANNGVNVVKIYDPKMIKDEPEKISCSGRALVSSGQEAKLFYRSFKDPDGDWLIQYDEKPLE